MVDYNKKIHFITDNIAIQLITRNVFRGQFLQDCIDLIGEDLVNEAWESKLADDALDYGNRLMKAADIITREKNLEYLKEVRNN